MAQDPTVEDNEFDLERKRQFASLYSFGIPIPKALVDSGWGTRSLMLGIQLLKDPFVQDEINKSREWVRNKLADNVNTLLEQLDRDRELAHLQDNPAAAVSATMAKAKLLGLLDPNEGKTPKKIVITWGDEGAMPE